MTEQQTTAIVDTLKNDSIAHGVSGSDWIMHHIMDSDKLDFAPFGSIPLPQIHLFGLDLSITKHVLFLWITAALLVFLM
ncbi:MAG: F0F1 ATP synthase subunit A, partial [Ignavibacteriaceae bacterium]